MKAIVYEGQGDASSLKTAEREVPVIKPTEVLIEVKAAGINRTDIIQRKGNYPAPPGVVQDILGLEVSGLIKETGALVGDWKVGDKVCALVPGGGYAQYVAADQGSCMSIPKGISMEDAAALPEVLLTVWHNVFQRGHLQRGERVLIYGGSGGIGSMAIQLVSLFGAEVVTLAGSKEKMEFCYSLGAQQVLLYKETDLLKEIPSDSIDLILDSLGGDYLPVNLILLAPEGRLVYINGMAGLKAPLEVLKVMKKRLHITGSTLRARSLAFKKELTKEVIEKAFPLLESGDFKNIVRHRFPFEEAGLAHALMESRDFYGKIILLF